MKQKKKPLKVWRVKLEAIATVKGTAYVQARTEQEAKDEAVNHYGEVAWVFRELDKVYHEEASIV